MGFASPRFQIAVKQKMALLLASLYMEKWLLHVDFLPVGDKKRKPPGKHDLLNRKRSLCGMRLRCALLRGALGVLFYPILQVSNGYPQRAANLYGWEPFGLDETVDFGPAYT
jgi:hypothetical protein